MSTPNSVEGILSGAKKTLADANKFTQSVEGNPTSAFAPKKIPTPNLPHEHANAPYALARELRAKDTNVDQYKKAVETNPNP
jgi:hypothetical protein